MKSRALDNFIKKVTAAFREVCPGDIDGQVVIEMVDGRWLAVKNQIAIGGKVTVTPLGPPGGEAGADFNRGAKRTEDTAVSCTITLRTPNWPSARDKS